MKMISKRLTAAALACALVLSSLVSVTAAQPTSPETTLNWGQFLGNETLRGVSDAKTPTSGEDLKKNWEVDLSSGPSDWSSTPGTPIVVGDYAYCYIKYELLKIDLNTGEIVKRAPAPGSNMFFITIVYGDGKIFVPRESQDKNYVIAYDADTLEQLFETEAIPGSQLQSPVVYHDGHIYLGSRANNPEYVCFSTEDTDPTRSDEQAKAVWSKQAPDGSLGFGWVGAAFKDDYCFFADASGTVWSVNAKTGEEIDSLKLSENESVASTLNYYEKNNRLYISSSADSAVVRSFEVNKDGTLNRDTVKMYNSGRSGGGTQSSPVIYNDRLYLGGGGGTAGSSEPFHVIDANTLQEIYTVDGLLTKGSAVLTTAYATAENNNEVMLYLIPYAPDQQSGNSVMYILKDREGQTEPNFQVVQEVGARQYCTQSVAVDKNGNLVFYNDAKKLYSYGRADETSREVTGADVAQQIDRLPEVDQYEYYNAFEISRIQERYNNLSDAQKAVVANVDKLEKIAAVAEQDPIERMQAGIASLPSLEQITLEDQSKIQTLYTAYQGLSEQEQAKVTSAEALEAAYAKILELRDDEQVRALVEDIDALPTVGQLVSADKTTVEALQKRYDALGEALQAKVGNAEKIEQAAARIEAIEKQMARVAKLIVDKLENVNITIENIGLIDEIDQAAAGLVLEDVLKIENYNQIVLSAKRKAVNLLISEKLLPGGVKVTVTSDNAAELSEVLDRIEAYYAMLDEEARLWIDHYEAVDEVRAEIAALQPESGSSAGAGESADGGKTGSGNLPITGETAGVLAGAGVLAAALCAAVVLRKRRSL